MQDCSKIYNSHSPGLSNFHISFTFLHMITFKLHTCLRGNLKQRKRKLLRNLVYCFLSLCIQQTNMQTMIVKHQFHLYKLLVNKWSSYLFDQLPKCPVTKMSGYQIVRLPNCPVTKLSGYQIVGLPIIRPSECECMWTTNYLK